MIKPGRVIFEMAGGEVFDASYAALAPFGTDDGRASVVRLVKDHVATPGKRRGWPLVVVAAVVVVVGITAVAIAVLHRGSGATPAVASAIAVETAGPAPASASAPAPAPAPAPVSAPLPHHALPRPRSPGNPSVVRSAATNDRY